MDDSAICVFTARSAPDILAEGGSGPWVLNVRHARQQRFLVCTRNDVGIEPQAREPHRSAFLVGRIGGLSRLPLEGVPRWRIDLEEVAHLEQVDVWGPWRNPVRYTSLRELGIDPDRLAFEPLARSQFVTFDGEPDDGRLTLAEAKRGLARTFGVDPSAIEIIIRG